MPKRLQVYETPEITVTFDPNRCVHSRSLRSRVARSVRCPPQALGET